MIPGLITKFGGSGAPTAPSEFIGSGWSAGADNFGFGDNVVVAGSQCFAVGKNLEVSNSSTFSLPPEAVFMHGVDIDGDNTGFRGLRSAFLQGRDIRTGMQGAAEDQVNWFMQGTNLGGPVGWNNQMANAKNLFLQGQKITWVDGLLGQTFAYKPNGGGQATCIFAQGADIYIGRHYYSFTQGYNIQLSTGNEWSTFVQGHDFSLTGGGNSTSFSQGYGYGGAGALGYASFSQGAAVTVSGDYSFGQGGWYVHVVPDFSFAQGQAIYCTEAGASAKCIFMQGDTITVSGTNVRNCFTQGNDLNLNVIGGECFFQGRNVKTGGAGTTGLNVCFAQGDNIQFTTASGTGYATRVFAHGSSHTFNLGSIPSLRESFFQGQSHTFSTGAYGSSLFIQGSTITISNSVSFAFAQGTQITLDGCSRAFAQGRYAHVTRDDQKTWGSNRALLGGAQSSKLIKHTFTTNATQTTIATLDLEEDKTYSIRVHVTARNTTTNAESATWVLTLAMAYRDTAGAAVLQGGNINFNTAGAIVTRSNTGGDAATWDVDLNVSTNDILLQVTGDTTDRLEWIATMEFDEVAG